MNDFLGNLIEIVPSLAQVVQWTVFLIGVIMVAGAMFNAAKIANGDTQAGGGWTGTLIAVVVGCLLIGIPELMRIGQESLFGDKADYVNQLTAYVNKVDDGMSEQSKRALMGAFAAVQLIGWLAFIKGWVMIKSIGEGKGGNTGYGHAAVFIVSGMLAVNIGVVLDGLGLTPDQILSAVPGRG